MTLRTLSKDITSLVGCGILAGLLSCGGVPDHGIIDDAILKSQSQQADRGLVWLFPGLVGATNELEPAYRAFRDAGIDKKYRFFEWDRPGPDFMGHLVHYEANRAQAAQIAAEITEYRESHPDAPIDLVGYSAGGALAVWVAEALPEDVRISRIVIAQSDLSPEYDLTVALEHVDDQLVHFYCPTDWILSGGFNVLFGTLDREYVVGAGKDGFVLEQAVADETLRDKVEQVAWEAEWTDYGHPGNHIAILQYRWNRYIVAPYLLEDIE